MKKILIGFGMIAIFLTACGGPVVSLASSAEDVLGIFASTGGATYANFLEDDTLRLGPSRMLVTSDTPVSPPSDYWFEGNRLHIKAGGDVLCDEISAIYEVRLLETGNLSFVAIDDPCDHRLVVLQGVIDLETGEPSTEWVPVD
jgi:hypothetical protein